MRTLRGLTRLKPDQMSLNGDEVRSLKPTQFRVPLHRTPGGSAEVLVSRRQEVKRGERLAEPGNESEVPVFSPVSGKVSRVSRLPVPGGGLVEHAEITPEAGEDDDAGAGTVVAGDDGQAISRANDRMSGMIGDAGKLAERAVQAGIDMGRLDELPLGRRLARAANGSVEHVVVPAFGAEPGEGLADWLARNRPEAVVAAAGWIARALGLEAPLFVTDRRRRQVRSALQSAAERLSVAVRFSEQTISYPLGHPWVLAAAVTGKPPGAGAPAPENPAALVLQPAEAVALAEAVSGDSPVLDRYIELRTDSARHVVRAPIGGALEELLEFVGESSESAATLVEGGDMTGEAVPSIHYSVRPTTSGYRLSAKVPPVLGPCVRCGRCVDVCPVGLLPFRFVGVTGTEDPAAPELRADACIECGACAAVCPARIPLVGWVRFAKSGVPERDLGDTAQQTSVEKGEAV